MIGYVMLGTNNLKSAVNFFDNVLEPLGLKKVEVEDSYAGYAQKDKLQEIKIINPISSELSVLRNSI